MSFEFFATDDTTPISTQDFTSATTLETHLWWAPGVPGAGPADPCYLQVTVGGATSGVPPLDAQECQVRIVGSSNPGADPLFAPALTGWTRIGTNAVFPLPTFRGDCAVHLEIRWVLSVGPGGAQATFAYEITPYYGTLPAENIPALLGNGIITGLADSSVSEWITSVACVESGSPDDFVNIPLRRWMLNGVPYAGDATTVQLDQNDGASDALLATEGYWAVLTQGASATPTLTKGIKAVAASAVIPDAPAGELPLERTLVLYGAGGSVITNSDIVNLSVGGRYEVRAGTGLTCIVGAGRAFVGQQYVAAAGETMLALDASTTTTVYIDTIGPVWADQSVHAYKLAEVDTDGSGVTAVRDLRDLFYEPRAEVVRLIKTGTESVAADVAQACVPYKHAVDRFTMSVRTASAGATGSTDCDIDQTTAGTPTTIFTGGVGIPSLPAQEYTARGAPLVTTGEAGDWYSLDIDAITSGGSQAVDVCVALVVAPRP